MPAPRRQGPPGSVAAFGGALTVALLAVARWAWVPAAQPDGWSGAGLGVLALTALVVAAVLTLATCLVALGAGSAPQGVAVPVRPVAEPPPRQWDPDAAGRPRPRAPGGPASPPA